MTTLTNGTKPRVEPASRTSVSVHVVAPSPMLFSAVRSMLETPLYPELRAVQGLPSPIRSAPRQAEGLRHTGSGGFSSRHATGAYPYGRTVIVKVLWNEDLSELAVLRTRFAGVPIVALNMNSSTVPQEHDVLRARGMLAVIGCDATPEQFIDAVLRLVGGEGDLAFSPTNSNGFGEPEQWETEQKGEIRPVSGYEAEMEQLTEREKEVLSLIAKGATNSEIASTLYMSINTVKTHVRNILSKLKASNRTQAASIASDLRFVDPHEVRAFGNGRHTSRRGARSEGE